MKNPNERHKELLEYLEHLKSGWYTPQDVFDTDELTKQEKEFLLQKFIEHKDEVLKSGEIEADLYLATDPIDRKGVIRTWGSPDSNKKFSPIEDHTFAIIAGRGGTGKTAYSFFLAEENAKAMKVCYVSLEMTKSAIVTRLARDYAKIQKHEWRDKSLISQEQRNLYKKRRSELRSNKNLKLIGFENSPSLETILESIKAYSPSLAFIDNLDLIQTDQFEKDPQKIICEQISIFCRKELIPIVLIHHMRKSNGRTKVVTGDDMRGTGKIRDNIDALMMCKRAEFDKDMSDVEKAMFMVMEEKDREFGTPSFHTYYFDRGRFVDDFQGVKDIF